MFVVLLAGAGTLLASLIALQRANTGYNMRQVLAIDVPGSAPGVDGATSAHLLQEAVAPGCRALGSCDSPVRGRGESLTFFRALIGGTREWLRMLPTTFVARCLPWTAADANPIRVIGLGTEILELGLTDDQPYALVQMFAHGLVIQCHPDRVDPRCSCSEAAILGVIGAAKRAAERAVEHVAMDWTYFAGVRSSTAIDVGKERAFTPKPSRTI